jgi:hypothetical protein
MTAVSVQRRLLRTTCARPTCDVAGQLAVGIGSDRLRPPVCGGGSFCATPRSSITINAPHVVEVSPHYLELAARAVARERGANIPIANQYGLPMVRAQFSIEAREP